MRFLMGVSVAAFALLCVATLSGAREAQKASVTIDTTRAGAPISKYIYGQFIEHLGRCIYGGIWSEMLQDRKFYYPVTGEAPAWEMFKPGPRSWDGEGHPYELLARSPWMIIGDKGAVKMLTAGAYVGEHTPEITLASDKPAGIMHERLGLEAGKEYVGRIVLAGDATAGPVQVSLVWGPGASDRATVVIEKLGAEYAKFPLRFRSGGSTDNGRLEIAGQGQGRFRIGTVSVMPADNINGWRADTVALLKQLDSPVYRWPGGNFVSGYDWKDGIGDPDRRPPRKNPAWKGIEHNDVGIHEFMALCREIGAEPYIAVNTGLGGAEGAAQEVEYLNGASTTPMGQLRAQNGHPLPYGVKFWAVGNEMYGDWQLGHMPLKEYVKKHNRVVEAMRAVDPTIRPVGVGALGDWSREMLSTCANHMSLISEHIYWQNKADLVEHVQQVPAAIRRVAETHRGYRRELKSLRGKDIRIALDEWNFWYGPNEYGELGTRYFLQDGLGIAAGLHEYFRNSDIFEMANYAQTVNVIGAIKTTATDAALEATGQVLALYRQRFGTVPLAVASPEQTALDVAAARTQDGSNVTIAIVNPTEERWQVALSMTGASPTGLGRRFVLSGPSRWAFNAPGRAPQVELQQTSFAEIGDALEAPPLSVSLYSLEIR
jgi:alpha-N-arabinofuranosidase